MSWYKHTDAPWVLSSIHEFGKVQVIEISGRNTIGWVAKVSQSELLGIGVGVANTRLISAAPDLLDALENMVREFDDNFSEGSTSWDAIRRSKEAIAKATAL